MPVPLSLVVPRSRIDPRTRREPDVLIVQINDTFIDTGGAFTAWGNGDDQGVPPGNPMQARGTIAITVNPIQDTPTLVDGGAQSMDEDGAAIAINPITAFDIDVRTDLVPNVDTITYDSDWIGQVTVSVGHGLLTVGTTAGLVFIETLGIAIQAFEHRPGIQRMPVTVLTRQV